MDKSFESFMSTIKPGCLLHHDEEHNAIQKLTELNFPNAQIRHDLTLFFQSEELKNKFLTQSKGLKPGTAEYHKAIGLALGYPPMAADFFARSWINRKLWDEAVTFEYHGYCFNSHKDDAQSIAQWLWENVPITPSEVKVKTLDGNEYYISPDL